ncbi:MAG: hypothetical protein R2815_04230 [Flavobacteriales bacterium]|nr:periplasmic heavy metal sensor [Flavobacteriales bacterium]
MTKLKLMGIALVVLVLVNLGTLAVLYFGRAAHHGPAHGEGPKAIIIERLRFDAEQVKRYEAMVEKHRAAIRASDSELQETRSVLYEELKGTQTSSRDSLLAALVSIQRGIEHTHLAHFEEIRGLCRPDQRPSFDDLTQDLATYFRMGGPPPPKLR